ncbi:MAG TPA: MgtC/SapB family protein [Melioribacteraceae bacterium]|nr:MgtC/SapB family protein [Melioribacteraceae bacterium]
MDTILQGQINEGIPLLWQKIFIALMIGLLIGVERERAKNPGEQYFAGIRTFPLISMLGFVCALISSFTTIYFFITGFIIFGALVSIEYFITAQKGELGGTTELTLLLVYVLGGMVFWEYFLLSAAISVVITVFLSLKTKFRTFAGMVSEEDIFATLKFLIITIIVLPILPNKTVDPFEIINPLKIWYFVILISGISFIGYILFKIIGSKKGIIVLSMLGGVASSTAVTLSFSQRSKENTTYCSEFGSGILLATSIMYPRVLFIVFLLNPLLGMKLILPFLILSCVTLYYSYIYRKKNNMGNESTLELTNPFKLFFAIKFGIVLMVLLFISGLFNKFLGYGGVFLAAFIGGFASLDAAILSVVNVGIKSVGINILASAILCAISANTIFKMLAIYFSAYKDLRKFTFTPFIIINCLIILFCGYYILL